MNWWKGYHEILRKGEDWSTFIVMPWIIQLKIELFKLEIMIYVPTDNISILFGVIPSESKYVLLSMWQSHIKPHVIGDKFIGKINHKSFHSLDSAQK